MPTLTRSYEQVMQDLTATHTAKSRKRHPLWTGLMQGKFSRAQVQEFLRQFIVVSGHLEPGWNRWDIDGSVEA